MRSKNGLEIQLFRVSRISDMRLREKKYICVGESE
jgi:hypothetical protein